MTHFYPGPMAYFGDPTIRMKTRTTSLSRLSVGGSGYSSNFVYSTTISSATSSGVFGEIELRNTGAESLIVNGVQYVDYTTTAQIDKGNGGRWSVSGYDNLPMNKYGTMSIPPGGTKKLIVQLNRQDHGGNVATGTHTGYFHFTCNDPRIGAFRVKVTGTLP
jgi:hypothetical protein